MQEQNGREAFWTDHDWTKESRDRLAAINEATLAAANEGTLKTARENRTMHYAALRLAVRADFIAQNVPRKVFAPTAAIERKVKESTILTWLVNVENEIGK